MRGEGVTIEATDTHLSLSEEISLDTPPVADPRAAGQTAPRAVEATVVNTREKKSGRRTKTPLPENLGISERVRQWAEKKGYGHLEEHLEAFRRKAMMNGYRNVDWDLAFMEAVREDWAKLRSNGRGAAPPPERRAPPPPLPPDPPGTLIPQRDCPWCGGAGVNGSHPCVCLHPESSSYAGCSAKVAAH